MMRSKNKRGSIEIVIFFIVLFLIMIIGFMAAIILGVVDFAGDTITPVLEGIGVVGPTNVSQATQYSVGTFNTFLQALPWVVAFAYVAALIFSIIFAMSFTFESPHPVFIGFYFILMILLIFGAILMSNMYEDIYSQDNVLSERLQEQTALSYMLLYSPFIFTVITFITGIYLFSRTGDGGFGL